MGSILTSTLGSLEQALDLPQASTLCNQCGVVCPVKIPLPDLMRKLREKQFARGLRPWPERAGLWMWGRAARYPALYALLSSMGARVLAQMGGSKRLIHYLPLAGSWTKGRDLPAPVGRTFRELYAARRPR
jgi:L-lactate dehydrogenase complex protein LldF